jgi:hypothetical protein
MHYQHCVEPNMKQMRRSKQVMLVLSGIAAMGLTGCERRQPQPYNNGWGNDQQYTNNQYVAGRGYYHSTSGGFYPFMWNSYRPGMGYYSDGGYRSSPAPEPPARSFTPSTTSRSSSFSSSRTKSTSTSVSRGGFGSSFGRASA